MSRYIISPTASRDLEEIIRQLGIFLLQRAISDDGTKFLKTEQARYQAFVSPAAHS